jgi:hypothetical protein
MIFLTLWYPNSPGVNNVQVDGFSDTVHRTGVDAHNGFVNSMTAQAEWRSDFVTERERVLDHAK